MDQHEPWDAVVHPHGPPRPGRGRSARRERGSAYVRRQRTGSIWAALVALGLSTALFAAIAIEPVLTQVATASRGVAAQAEVQKVTPHRYRSPGYAVLELVDDRTLRVEVSRWPSGMAAGDVVTLTYDGQNPGRAIVAGTPAFTTRQVTVSALLVLVAGLLGWYARPAGTVLSERLGLWLRSRPRPDDPRSRGQARRAARRWWQAVADSARRHGTARGLACYVLLPLVTAGLGVTAAFQDVQRLVALEARGVAAEATVTGSLWSGGGGTALYVELDDGTTARIRNWEGVPRAGETVDVVVDPHNPSHVAMAGIRPWATLEWIAAVVGVGGVVATVVFTPAAVAGLVRRPPNHDTTARR